MALYKDEYECFINNIKKSTIDNSIEKLVELICFHVKYAEKKLRYNETSL